jgi:hypothetical protein
MDGLYEQARIAVYSVWRRRWLALAVAWGLCLVGWLAVALIPNSYESKARVFAQMQSILPDKIGITAAERQGDLLRVKQTLTSTQNLEKVVRRTDLNLLVASERDLAAQVENLRENIKITAQQDNLFEISATSGVGGFSERPEGQDVRGDRAEPARPVRRGESRPAIAPRPGQTLTFLDEELRRRERALQEAEQRRVDFETRVHGHAPGEGSIDQRMAAARLGAVEQSTSSSCPLKAR